MSMYNQLVLYKSECKMDYLEALKHTKYDLAMNIDLGCHNLIIKNYKTFEYIVHKDGVHGIGISSIYIPIAEFIKAFEIDTVQAEISSHMDAMNLGIYMIITKEFRKDENDKDVLYKEIMIYYDQFKLCNESSQVEKLITAMEANTAMALKDRKDYFIDDRNVRLIRWEQDNIKQDRKTLDKFLKDFYAANKPDDMN